MVTISTARPRRSLEKGLGPEGFLEYLDIFILLGPLAAKPSASMPDPMSLQGQETELAGMWPLPGPAGHGH